MVDDSDSSYRYESDQEETDEEWSDSTYIWGSEVTANPQISVSLINKTREKIVSHFKSNGMVTTDVDAFSIVISAHEMTNELKDAIRQYLLSFGQAPMAGCSVPSRPIGGKKVDGMFGCSGTVCQHLPRELQGEEILVLDSPIKIGVHESCRDNIVAYLRKTKKKFLVSSTKNSGICFDPRAAATKPSYKDMVDAIIESCKMQNVSNPMHIIHVAQLGCRHPLPDADEMLGHFRHFKTMTTAGATVELIQFDIAFVVDLPRDKLFQANCVRRHHQEPCLLQDASTTVFPLHNLPKFDPRKIEDKKIEGTINVKKTTWNTPTKKTMVDIEPQDNKIADLYLSHSPGTRRMRLNRNTVHSLKLYSTVAHPLMQRREKFPLSYPSLRDVPKKSFESIQTLTQNLNISLREAFNIARIDGIGIRIEVSIRPAVGDDKDEQDNFRQGAHFNDILFLACMALDEFIVKWNPIIKYYSTREIETRAITLISQLSKMTRYRKNIPFNNVYVNSNQTAWLQAHLSILMITIGIIPVVSTRFIKSWLAESTGEPFDPFNLIAPAAFNHNHIFDEVKRRMLGSLFKHLREGLHFSKEGTKVLCNFLNNKNIEDPIKCFSTLSLKDKHLLAQNLWDEIIPHLSNFLSQKKNEPESNLDRERSLDANREDETEDDYDDTDWWKEDHHIHRVALSKLTEISQSPSHPLAFAILALIKMSFLWGQDRPGHTQALFRFVYKSIKRTSNEDTDTLTLLKQNSNERCFITRDVIRELCSNMKLCTANKKHSTEYYLNVLCEKFGFPSSLIKYELPHGSKEERNELNCALNDALFGDRTVIVNENVKTSRVFRMADNTFVDIHNIDTLLTQTEHLKFSPNHDESNSFLEVVAKALHSHLNAESFKTMILQELTKTKCLHTLFLASTGITNEDFKGCTSIAQLNNKFSNKLPPDVILAMTTVTQVQNFLWYDKKSGTTSLFCSVGSRCIKYKVKGTKSVPNKLNQFKILLSTTDGYHSLVTIPIEHYTRSQFTPHCVWKRLPQNHSTQTLRRLADIPNKSTSSCKSINAALSKQLGKIDPDYLVSNDKDQLGIVSYLEDLSCSAHPATRAFFHPTTIAECFQLGFPLKMLILYMKDECIDNLSHKLLCPILCLKHHNLIMAVIESISRTKKTFFYAFDHYNQAVECITYEGYKMNNKHPQTLYLCWNGKSAHYCLPSNLAQNEQWLLPHKHSLTGLYSHIGINCLKEKFLPLFQKIFDMRGVLREENFQEEHFRPSPGHVYIAVTSVTSTSVEIQHLMMKDVQHHALMFIFPRNTETAEWNACIVHHPLQPKSAALRTLKAFTSRASRGGHWCYTIPGMYTEQRAAGHLMLLYAYLGSKCSGFNHFLTTMKSLSLETQISSRVKNWVYDVINAKKPREPGWIKVLMKCTPPPGDCVQNQHPKPGSRSTYIIKHGDHSTINKRPLPQDTSRDARRLKTADLCRAHFQFLLLENNPSYPYLSFSSPGTQNPGQLCYMITVVQLLYGMRCSRSLFSNGSFFRGQNFSSLNQLTEFGHKGGFIALGLQHLFEEMHLQNRQYTLSCFKNELVSHPTFRAFDNERQHDANELLVNLLDILSNTLKLNDGNDPISEWCRSSVSSCIQCSNCNHSNRNDSDTSISIELALAGTSIYHCLAHHFSPEEIHGWRCEQCHIERNARKTLILQPRNILILTLKRYSISGEKDHRTITSPLNCLDITPFMPSDSSESFSTKYALVAIINHYGESQFNGHYDLFLRQNNTQWTRYDDSELSRITDTELVTNNAYIFVYCTHEKYNEYVGFDI